MEVVMHDDRFEKIPYDDPTDLVAITVETFTARRAYEISASYRKRGVPVVLGGVHPTLVPAEAAARANAVFTGDAEAGWSRVVDDAARGRLARRYSGTPGPPQGSTRVNREIFRDKPYLPIRLVQFGRGCPHECTFCATGAYFQRRHFVGRLDRLLAEIDVARRLIFLVDDNIVANKGAAKELFRALIPLRIRWVSQASIDMVRDRELMRLMAASGCAGLVVGLESTDPRNLRHMRKSPTMRGCSRDYSEELAILRDHGVMVWGAFTFGHDWDTEESIRRTADTALRQRLAFAAFNILTPYPATPLYRQLKRDGRLLHDGRWWLHPDYRFNHAVFTPARLGPQELADACFRARRQFNRPGAIVKRAIASMPLMRDPGLQQFIFRSAFLVRKEVLKKQGLPLGDSKET